MKTLWQYWLTTLTAITLAIAGAGVCHALTLTAGDYYFDNTKQRYTNVRLAAGSNSSTTPYTIVTEFTNIEGTNLYKGTLQSDITNVDFFAFICSTVPAGEYHQRIGIFLDSLYRNEQGFIRTYTLSTPPPETDTVLWVFCPTTDRPYSDGYWRPDYSYTAHPSGTLPVIHLNTQDSASIVSRDYYINGNLWIDNCETPLGSEASPLPLEIKGRGNWTWNHYYKKPYKVKFTTKQAPLGLDKSRHFILLPHASDDSGYLRNFTGFELSRLLEMPYTPTETPVELILNGEYQGLYFLCEKIRVESGRVDIYEQADGETIPENVTGGWLLELTDDGDVVISQHQNNDPQNPIFNFVSRSPEVLSTVQRNYIHDLIRDTDSCIYVADKSDQGWERYLDMNTVARFYVIHEVMENVESFSGSLFMYKDLGDDEKLHFGPVWDFDNSFYQKATTSDHFIFDYGTHYPFLWIKELLKFPRFQHAVREVWHEFMEHNVWDITLQNIWQWRELLAEAKLQDKLRWYQYASAKNDERAFTYLNVLSNKIAWLDARWGNVGDVNMDGNVNAADITAIYNVILGMNMSYYATSDINNDNAVNAADVTALYNIILGED